MNRIVSKFVAFLKHLSVIHNITRYFNEEERQLVVQSLVIGVVVWAVVFGLKTAVYQLFAAILSWIEIAPTPLLILVPLLVGALFVAALTQFRPTVLYYQDQDGRIRELNDVEGDGLERAISLYYSSEPSLDHTLTRPEGVQARWDLPTFSLAGRKFLATLLSLGSGGSGGLAAGAALIGESVAAGLFKPRRGMDQVAARFGLVGRFWRWWYADQPDLLQTAQLSGIAAAIAVLLGAPFAAAFFATEVMYRSRPVIEKLIYALISALVAFFLTDIVTLGQITPFAAQTLYVPPINMRYFAVLGLVGILVSLVSRNFRWLRNSFDRRIRAWLPDVWRRHLVGAAVTGVVALVVHYSFVYFDLSENGLLLVLGPGETAVDLALSGELTITVALVALVAKILATLFTITSGGSAGLLLPTLFFGAMVASTLATVFGYEPIMLIVPAMVASLVSIANVPLAAILFAVEVFGSVYMVPALFMLVLASLLAHEQTIYRTQRDAFEGRQVLPGVSVRRERIPASWAGHTLIDLEFRKQFDLNVIGLMEQIGENRRLMVRLGSASSTVLTAGDILVVLGRDEKLVQLEETLTQIRAAEESQEAAK